MRFRIASPSALAPLALAGCVVDRSRTEQTIQVAERGEDRAAIHALLVAYGETLDAGDFDAFGKLFAMGGVYAGGAGGAGLSGPQAAEALRRTFTENALGFGNPRAHLFFNEVIRFTGTDEASATSNSLYMVPGPDGAPQAALMAAYRDRLVREDGAWKFARREVTSLLPAPAER